MDAVQIVEQLSFSMAWGRLRTRAFLCEKCWPMLAPYFDGDTGHLVLTSGKGEDQVEIVIRMHTKGYDHCESGCVCGADGGEEVFFYLESVTNG